MHSKERVDDVRNALRILPERVMAELVEDLALLADDGVLTAPDKQRRRLKLRQSALEVHGGEPLIQDREPDARWNGRRVPPLPAQEVLIHGRRRGPPLDHER